MACNLYISVLLILCTTSFAKVTYASNAAEDTGCLCEKYTCGCCLLMVVPKIGLNDSACINITYLPDEYGIHFTLNIDKVFLYNKTISARNPPSLCAGIPFPYVKEIAELCVHFYDLDATLSSLHGCVELEAEMETIVVAKYDLGCFNIGKVNENNKKKWKNHQSTLLDKVRSLLGRSFAYT